MKCTLCNRDFPNDALEFTSFFKQSDKTKSIAILISCKTCNHSSEWHYLMSKIIEVLDNADKIKIQPNYGLLN